MAGYKLANDQSGAAAVEFALILPVMLLFIFGIIEFGLFMYNKQVLTNACREGARVGIVVRSPRSQVNEDAEIRADGAAICPGSPDNIWGGRHP